MDALASKAWPWTDRLDGLPVFIDGRIEYSLDVGWGDVS
jgi:hypothetical protein